MYREIKKKMYKSYKKFKGLVYIKIKTSTYDIPFIQENFKSNSIILDVGSGEGVLSFIFFLLGKGKNITCIDTDSNKISFIRESKLPMIGICNNILDFTSKHKYDLIILNDFLHHKTDEDITKIIKILGDYLAPNGVIYLKEFDKNDFYDYFYTFLWDSFLYPEDKLNFKNKSQWIEIFNKNKFELRYFKKYTSLWPASRSQFIFNKNV